MKKIKVIVLAELFSLVALTFVFFKVLLISPRCFDIFDSYFTILPLFITKTIELSQIRLIKNE